MPASRATIRSTSRTKVTPNSFTCSTRSAGSDCCLVRAHLLLSFLFLQGFIHAARKRMIFCQIEGVDFATARNFRRQIAEALFWNCDFPICDAEEMHSFKKNYASVVVCCK